MPNIPNVKWAQRSDKVYLTIEVAGCEGPKIKLDNDAEGGVITFSGKANNGTQYDMELHLCGKIKPEESKVSPQRFVLMAVQKEEPGYWKKLTGGPAKDNTTHIKVDWDRWVDEDEEGEATANPFNLDELQDYSSFISRMKRNHRGGRDSDDEEGLEDLVK